MLREQIGDEHEAGEQGEREKGEARADQAKHDALERVERRQHARQIGDAPGAQPTVEEHQQAVR